jgi:hypothetical protein
MGLKKSNQTSFKDGHIPWNKGLKGWNSGKKNPFYGKKHSQTVIDAIIKSNTGRKMSEEHKQKIIESVSGENNNNWKGGITPYSRKIRASCEWKKWREKVFTRDDYTCKQCGIYSDKEYGKIEIHPHHRIPVRKLIKTKFEKYIYNIKNGITLCKPCHDLIPKK